MYSSITVIESKIDCAIYRVLFDLLNDMFGSHSVPKIIIWLADAGRGDEEDGSSQMGPIIVIIF